MGCDCNGSALFCTGLERRACVQASCQEGAVFTNFWAPEEAAWECARSLTRQTGDLHFVESRWYSAEDAPVGVDTYTMVSNNRMRCEPGSSYEGLFGSNRWRAERCAEMLNVLMEHEGHLARFRAVVSGARLLFADAWEVQEF